MIPPPLHTESEYMYSIEEVAACLKEAQSKKTVSETEVRYWTAKLKEANAFNGKILKDRREWWRWVFAGMLFAAHTSRDATPCAITAVTRADALIKQLEGRK